MAKTVTLTQQLKKRFKIAESIAELRRDLDEIDADIFTRFGRLASAIDGEPTPSPAFQFPVASTAEPRSRGKAVIIPAVTNTLRQRGTPLRTSELLAALGAAGVQVGGKRPVGNLSAQMSLSGMFESVDGEWWFKGEQRVARNQAAHAG